MNPGLIEDLKSDLQPVRPAPPVGWSFVLWFLASWVLILGVTLWLGPLRPDVGEQLSASPRFLLECLVGLAVVAAAGYGVLALATPGYATAPRLILPGLVLVASWAGAALYSLVNPAFAPSMAGKRELCFYQTFFFSLLPLGGLFYTLRNRLAFNRVWAGVLAGIASASIPALTMQVACMYDPWHMLTHHLAPIALLGLLGGGLGWRLLPRA